MKIEDLTPKQRYAGMECLNVPDEKEVQKALDTFGEKSLEDLIAIQDELYDKTDSDDNEKIWDDIAYVEIVIAIKKA